MCSLFGTGAVFPWVSTCLETCVRGSVLPIDAWQHDGIGETGGREGKKGGEFEIGLEPIT